MGNEIREREMGKISQIVGGARYQNQKGVTKYAKKGIGGEVWLRCKSLVRFHKKN